MEPFKKLFKEQAYLTDGGLETTLIFLQGIELREFAAFELLAHEQGRQVIRDYFNTYLQLAKKYKAGFILEAPTWRSNPDWGQKLGYDLNALQQLNSQAIQFLHEIRNDSQYSEIHTLISGCIGPRGSGYVVEKSMGKNEAADYHLGQINSFKSANADFCSALTMNYLHEAQGIVMAAQSLSFPVVISFTVETDGRLPSGEFLKDVIEAIDNESGNYPLYYMVNCAHPQHFLHVFSEEGVWKDRILGIRANASTKSHQELDESESLDKGDYNLLAEGYRELKNALPNLLVYGGCCGTDHSHIDCIGRAVFR